MVPTSANSLQKKKLWPPPMKNRPGRPKRRRYESKQLKDKTEAHVDIDPDLPSFSHQQLQLFKQVIRTCTLCGEIGHYAATCKKPNTEKVVKTSKQYRKYEKAEKKKKKKNEMKKQQEMNGNVKAMVLYQNVLVLKLSYLYIAAPNGDVNDQDENHDILDDVLQDMDGIVTCFYCFCLSSFLFC